MAGAQTGGALDVVEIAPRNWRASMADLIGRGGGPRSLFAARSGADVPEVRCLALAPAGPVLLTCAATDGSAPSLVDLAPSLQWDEREARDLYGVVFAGHEPHRSLVSHPAEPGAWTTSIVGDDVHQVAVGPIHAGVIESGHFRFHAVGERVLHVDIRLFYKHRGLERDAEGRTAAEALGAIRRACAGCSVANSIAYAQAVEQAWGHAPDEATRRVRTILLELERLWNHMNDIGAICSGVGFAPGAMAFASFKERAQRVARALTGHRFMFDTISVGGSRLEIPAEAAAGGRAALAALERDVTPAWRALLFDAPLRDRVVGAGVLPTEEARRLGTTGPAARASDVRGDTRERSPGLWYADFQAAAVPNPSGDVASRMEARAVEAQQTFGILDDLLSSAHGRGTTRAEWTPSEHGAGSVESARGETTCVVEMNDDRVRRVRLRTASYANWTSVARAATGGILPDFPLVNKSFELCYACVDR